MIKSKKNFLLIISLMGLILGVVFLLKKPNWGEGVILIWWFLICGGNVYGYFYNKGMFGFGRANVRKGESNQEARSFIFYMTIISYFIFMAIAFFTKNLS